MIQDACGFLSGRTTRRLSAASNELLSAEPTDLEDETEANTVSDSSASQTDPGVHWDFSSRSSVCRNQRTSHLGRIKEKDGAREVETGFPASDDAEESTITRYNATVAGLAHLCHCMHTPGFPLPRFHFSQLAQLPFEWPIARLSTDFPSIAASFSQNVSRLAVENALSGQRLTDSWLETTCEKFAWLTDSWLETTCEKFAWEGGHWSSCVSHCQVISRHWFC